jgi:hypothetical protein
MTIVATVRRRLDALGEVAIARMRTAWNSAPKAANSSSVRFSGVTK